MAEPPDPDPAPRAGAVTAKGATTRRPPGRTETLVARRVAESRATVPDHTLTAEVDMEAAVALHPSIAGDDPAVLLLDALVIRACALALRAHPEANGAWRDAQLERYSRVNVGLTVPVDGTLVVPTVFDADAKGPSAIAAELDVLAARARAGATTQPELSGATFTVSDLGGYGVRRFSAVIVPPQAGVLAVGALTRRATVHDGELAVRHGLDLTLSADHRILYGATAARFLTHIRGLLEAPAGLA